MKKFLVILNNHKNRFSVLASFHKRFRICCTCALCLITLLSLSKNCATTYANSILNANHTSRNKGCEIDLLYYYCYFHLACSSQPGSLSFSVDIFLFTPISPSFSFLLPFPTYFKLSNICMVLLNSWSSNSRKAAITYYPSEDHYFYEGIFNYNSNLAPNVALVTK